MTQSLTRVLSVFSLTMITVGSVDSIRNLPTTALFGSQLIAFFMLGALFFLIPAALTSAELASGWPMQGGIYIWVKEAFGKRMGFLAIWLQWISNVIWYPAILQFVGGTIGFLIAPSLINNTHFLWLVIVGTFWAITFINCYGMKISAFFATLCTLSGLLLPMTCIITLGALWVIDGNPLQIQLDSSHIKPVLNNPGLWTSLTAVMLSFCGIEIATVHANDVINPQRAFPKALAYSVLMIVSTLILGSLAIAVVLPVQDINLVAGIMQTVQVILARYHLLSLMPAMAFMLVLGALGSVNNWIIAPTKGLLIAAQDGNLPFFLQRINAAGAPVTMLIMQALIVTGFATMILYFPSVNGAYWFLTSLAAQLYMLMYALMFITVFKLRRSAPDQSRAFCVPGGKWGLGLIAFMGIIGVGTTFGVSFLPPPGIDVGDVRQYTLLLSLGLIVMCVLPFAMAFIEERCKRCNLLTYLARTMLIVK